jgi:hypothetical protein
LLKVVFVKIHKLVPRKPFWAWSVFAADVDGDEDLDVLAASGHDGRIVSRTVGDSNGDGAFNSADLVYVLQSGKYEDGIPRNATFAEGDWNGDEEFDSADLVRAFHRGHYEAAKPVAMRNIAVAVDWLFAHDEDLRKRRAVVAGQPTEDI